MFPRVKQVRHVRDYRLELGFVDGTASELDFRERIAGRGGVFRPLEDVEFFAQVRVDPEAGNDRVSHRSRFFVRTCCTGSAAGLAGHAPGNPQL